MNNIEEWLEKYWMCETSLEEEQELYRFFTEEEVPEHLWNYREVFLLKAGEREEALDDSFDERILAMITDEAELPVRRRRKLHPVWQVAASVAVLLSLWWTVGVQVPNSDPWKQETYETPEQALEEVQKILASVSGHIEKGQTVVDRNLEKIEPVTQILK